VGVLPPAGGLVRCGEAKKEANYSSLII